VRIEECRDVHVILGLLYVLRNALLRAR